MGIGGDMEISKKFFITVSRIIPLSPFLHMIRVMCGDQFQGEIK